MRDNTAIVLSDDRGEKQKCINATGVPYEPDALAQIVAENLSKVEAMARGMSRTPDFQDDLVSAGVEAMLKSLKSYVSIPGVPFFAYAKMFVRSSMLREAAFLSQLVDIPALHLRNARNGQLAPSEAALVLEAQFVLNIDEVNNTASTEAVPTAENMLINKDLTARSNQMLHLAVEALTEDEAEIIRARFLEEESVDELAARLDILPEKMRKIERRARFRMKTFLLKRGITAGLINPEN